MQFLPELIVTIGLILLVMLMLKKSKVSTSILDGQILLWGLPNSQKTRLYFKLLTNKLVDTTTSCSKNQETFQMGTDVYTIVDYGGHSKFDREVMSSLKLNTPLVYLVDSSEK